jgi:hypothetical protein
MHDAVHSLSTSCVVTSSTAEPDIPVAGIANGLPYSALIIRLYLHTRQAHKVDSPKVEFRLGASLAQRLRIRAITPPPLRAQP